MLDPTISDVLSRQYDRVWRSLRDAITKMSDQQWRHSECDWLVPVRLAYHIVETAEFFSGTDPKQYGWGSLGGN